MSDSSIRLDLPYMLPSQAQKHVTYNEALQRLDVLTQLVIAERNATIPPAVPQDGSIYALAAVPEGDWAGKGGQLAQWTGYVWQFLQPQDGWHGWDSATGHQCIYVDAQWQEIATVLQDMDGLGIGTDWDSTNRLAVASEASLFTHAGAGHQLKINKAHATDTASLLYQSGWSGHAEMGLAGDTDFHLKVSPDGSMWTEALRVDAQTGLLNGAAVQSGVTDGTAGRLMTVGAFGLGGDCIAISDFDDPTLENGKYYMISSGSGTYPESGSFFVEVSRASGIVTMSAWRAGSFTSGYTRNYFSGAWTDWVRIYSATDILGSVSQSGGTPTGAVIERGSNANGEYVRFADGTQICWCLSDTSQTADVAYGNVYRASSDVGFTFPAVFSSSPDVSPSSRYVSGAAHWMVPANTGAAGGTAGRIFSAVSGAVGKPGIVAIGRWFEE